MENETNTIKPTNATAQAAPGNEVFEKNKIKRWALLAYGTLMMMCVGVCYAWSILKGPISLSFGELWDDTLGGFVFTLFIYANSTFGVVSGLLISKLKTVKINIVLSSLLMLASFGVTSIAENFLLLCIGFGFLGGMGCAFTYNSVVVNVSKWFTDRIGVATGTLLMGFGFGSFVIGNIYTALLNVASWRNVIIFMGVAIAVILFIGAFLMSPPPVGYVAPLRSPKVDKFPVQGMECTPLQMIKRASFWFLFLAGCCNVVPGMVLSAFGRDLIISLHPTMQASLVALAVGVIPVANGCGRIFTGFINDYFGMGFNIRISAFAIFLGAALVMLAFALENLPFLIIAMIVLGFSAGMGMPDCAVVTRKLFGEKHYQVNLQVVMLGGYINSLGTTLFGMLLGLSGGYILPLAVITGLGLIGFILIGFIKKA